MEGNILTQFVRTGFATNAVKREFINYCTNNDNPIYNTTSFDTGGNSVIIRVVYNDTIFFVSTTQWDEIQSEITTNRQLSEIVSEAGINTTIGSNFTETEESINHEQEILETITPNLTSPIEETTIRFSGAQWAEIINNQSITLIGCGGIGSWTGLLLSRLGNPQIRLFDFDTIDASNMGGQLYQLNQIGERKVFALSNLIRKYNVKNNVYSYFNSYDVNYYSTPIMICGLDNMEARKEAFRAWKSFVFASSPASNSKEALFIDGRLAAEELQVYCIRGDDDASKTKYEKECLFSSEEAEETVCSYKQTSFCANMIASIIVNLVVNHCANLTEDIVLERDLPFFTYYNAERMFFKTE
jgi:molybdopterin/thiamine biosynthesis adenylyltransferase